jgi:tetratricopeptide (TPR) repeat protein
MRLSQIAGALIPILFAFICGIAELGFSQSFEIPNPLPQFQSQIRHDISKYSEVLTFEFTDAGAFNEVGVLPEAAAANKAKRRTDLNYRLEKTKEWRKAITEHKPGKADWAAIAIGGWNTWDLEAAIDFVTRLSSQPISSIKRELKKTQIRNSLALTDQEVQQGDLNRILKQGALLHTDIALLELEKGEYLDAGEREGAFIDGRVILRPKRPHWDYARRLMDSISPRPSQDQMAIQWYIATTAYMQSHRFLAYARQNLESALKIFPSNERILFYAGVLHEIYAMPSNQNIILPQFGRLAHGPKESELKEARQLFQKAIKVNPDFAEAHLRLGRTLGLLNLHEQAVGELQQAAVSIKDPQLLYYAFLFLGCELGKLSRQSEAGNQYEKAAGLFPKAQSPLLGLSQLARSNSDDKGALVAIQRLFALPNKDSWDEDPLWIYDLAHVSDADVLIAEMYNMFEAIRSGP